MKRSDRHPSGSVLRASDHGRLLEHRITPAAQALLWAAAWWHRVHPEAAGLGRVVRPGAVCLDIGADCGMCTGTLAVLAGPGGQVHCLDSPDRSSWWPAIASMLGGADVVVHRYPGGARTVDALCRQANLSKIDFIKADIAGSELGPLLGAFSTLLRDRPTLLLQIGQHRPVNRRRSTDVVRSLTKSLAYAMYCWEDGSWRPTTCVTPGQGRFLFNPRPIPTG